MSLWGQRSKVKNQVCGWRLGTRSVGYVASHTHGTCCTTAQVEIAQGRRKRQLPGEEVGSFTEAASSFSSKSSKAQQGFLNSFFFIREPSFSTGSWTRGCGHGTGQYSEKLKVTLPSPFTPMRFSPCLLYYLCSIPLPPGFFIILCFSPFHVLFLNKNIRSVRIYSYTQLFRFSFFQFFPSPCTTSTHSPIRSVVICCSPALRACK